MGRIGKAALAVFVGLLVVTVLASAAGRDMSAVLGPLALCFWGALAVALVARILRALMRRTSVRKELGPVADAAAAYNQLLTGTRPGAALSRELEYPPADDKGTSGEL